MKYHLTAISSSGCAVIRNGATRMCTLSTLSSMSSDVLSGNSCPCTSNPTSTTFLPQFVGNDYSCELEARDTYSYSDRLWDGKDCPQNIQSCCDKGSWSPGSVRTFPNQLLTILRSGCAVMRPGAMRTCTLSTLNSTSNDGHPSCEIKCSVVNH